MEKVCARILLLGKTGVGKSSFINYFVGQNVAETGIGKPVTQELEEYEIEQDGMCLNVTDSKGLEVENSEKIKEDIFKEIIRRNGKNNISEWFHTIFYCISVSNARIEKYEIEFLRELKGKISQNIHIILTNCDSNANKEDSEQIKAMKDKLKAELGDNIHIYKVCSIEMKKRNGTKIEPYGKEEIVKGVFDLLWDDICYKVAENFTEKELKPQMKEFLGNKKEEISNLIKKNISLSIAFKIITNEKELDKELDEKFGKSFKRYNREYKNEIAGLGRELHKKIKEVKEFYIAYYNIVANGNDIIENITDTFHEMLDLDLDKVFENSELERISNTIEKEKFKIIKIWRMGKATFNLKGLLLNLLNDTYEHIIEKIENFTFKEKIYQELKAIRTTKD